MPKQNRPLHQPFMVPHINGDIMHGRVRTLADMSAAEIAAIEAKYGMPVRPRSPEVAEDAPEGGGDALDENSGGVQPHEDAMSMVEAKKQKAT